MNPENIDDAGYNLEPEEFEIISEAVINYLSNRKGIYNFLKKKGQIKTSTFSFCKNVSCLEEVNLISLIPFKIYL